MFTSFETICYRSRNVVNTHLSTSQNILKAQDFLREQERTITPRVASPLKTEDLSITTTNKTKGLIVRQSLNQSTDFDIESTQDDTLRANRGKLDKSKKRVTIRDEDTSFKIIEVIETYREIIE